MDLQDKVVVITGSSSGIGQATAIAFAKQKAKVVITYKTNKKGALNTLTLLKKYTDNVLSIQGDFHLEKDVEELFNLTVKSFKTVDVLINIAGRAVPKPLQDTDYKYWLTHFNDNFFSTVLCSKAAIKIMQVNGVGKIINMSSVNGIDYMGRPDTEAYSAAKAAIISFTKTLANKLAPNILVNAVAPGKTKTSYYDRFDAIYMDNLVKSVPIERFITVEEIANTFIFIAQNDALTGEVIVADGGFSLKDY